MYNMYGLKRIYYCFEIIISENVLNNYPSINRVLLGCGGARFSRLFLTVIGPSPAGTEPSGGETGLRPLLGR